MVWILLAVLSFFGGQVYLFFGLRKLDQLLECSLSNQTDLTYDDCCRYPEEDVVK